MQFYSKGRGKDRKVIPLTPRKVFSHDAVGVVEPILNAQALKMKPPRRVSSLDHVLKDPNSLAQLRLIVQLIDSRKESDVREGIRLFAELFGLKPVRIAVVSKEDARKYAESIGGSDVLAYTDGNTIWIRKDVFTGSEDIEWLVARYAWYAKHHKRLWVIPDPVKLDSKAFTLTIIHELMHKLQDENVDSYGHNLKVQRTDTAHALDTVEDQFDELEIKMSDWTVGKHRAVLPDDFIRGAKLSRRWYQLKNKYDGLSSLLEHNADNNVIKIMKALGTVRDE